ncbi:hypothetical protein DL96DRAFT_1810542 [Flagelloscypha sp. PMI_526]|nr:hypothetical protein DL96DRAFT_1810542 [Flagelloscypha sp. PMI_526]
MSFPQVPTDTDLLNEARSNPDHIGMFRIELLTRYRQSELSRRLAGRDILEDSTILEVFRKKLIKWMREQHVALPHQAPPPAAPVSNPVPTFPSSQGFLGRNSTQQSLQARAPPIRAFNAVPSSLDTRNVNIQRTGRSNPRSVSDTATQNASNYQQGRGQRMGSNGIQRRQQPVFTPRQDVIAVILPLRYDESLEDDLENQENDTSVKYRFLSSKFSKLYKRLKMAGLTVPTSVPSTGVIPYLEILQNVTVALVGAGFEIPGYPSFKTTEDVQFPEPPDYDETWFTLAKVKQNGNSDYSSVALDGVVPAKFTYDYIHRTHPSNPSNMRPDGSDPPPLILMVPRTGSLRRSLNEFSTRMDVPSTDKGHACYGYYLLKTLPIWHESVFNNDITCEMSCPKAIGDIPAPREPTPPPIIGRPRPHPSPQAARVVRARVGRSPERQVPQPTPLPPAPALQAAPRTRLIQPNALEQGLICWPDTTSMRANIPSALLMRTFLKKLQTRVVPSSPNQITVLQVEDIKPAILDMVKFFVRNRTLVGCQLPEGAYQQQGQMLIQHLFNRDTHFTVGGEGSVTAGSSPALDVFTRLLKDLTDNTGHWRNGANGSKYKFPVFELTIGLEAPDFFYSFEEVGVAAAFYIGRYGMAPLPISPLIIFALACSSEDEMTSLSHAVVAFLEPEIFTLLADILAWKFGEERPTEYGHPINQFIIRVLGKEPGNTRLKWDDEDAYKQFMRLCWNQALFGVDDLFDHPAFKALRKGFWLSLGLFESGYETSVPEMLQTADLGLNLRRNILYLYNLIPGDVREVLPRLKCRAYSEGHSVLVYATILELRLRRYLLRAGHPESLKGVLKLSEEDWEKAQSDTTLRWRMLMVASTASSQIPPDPNWDIKIKVFSPTEDDNKQKEAIPINFHACFGLGDIILTLPMKKLLLDCQFSAQGDDSDDTFDHWLHSQLWVNTTGTAFFNRV